VEEHSTQHSYNN